MYQCTTAFDLLLIWNYKKILMDTLFLKQMNDVVSLKVRATLVEPPLVYTEESPADKVQKWNNPPVTPDEELDPIIRKFITMPAIDLDSLMKRPSRKKVKNFIKG